MQPRLLDAILTTVKGVHDRLAARIEALERRGEPVPVPGRDGRDGAPGPTGPPGPPGTSVDVAPLLDRIVALTRDHELLLREVDALRAQVATLSLPAAPSVPDDLVQRLVALEHRAPLPGPPGRDGLNGKDGERGLDGAPGRDGKDGAPGPAGQDGERGTDGKDGAPGRDGRDGKDGRDGVDGVGFDDLDAELDLDAKRLILRAIRDGRLKEWAWFLPFTRYRGVFEAGQTYLAADQVTHAGSMWIATAETTQRPDEFGDGARTWVLSAKRGRDGKAGPVGPAGKDGKDGRPGKDLTQLGPDGSKW